LDGNQQLLFNLPLGSSSHTSLSIDRQAQTVASFFQSGVGDFSKSDRLSTLSAPEYGLRFSDYRGNHVIVAGADDAYNGSLNFSDDGMLFALRVRTLTASGVTKARFVRGRVAERSCTIVAPMLVLPEVDLVEDWRTKVQFTSEGGILLRGRQAAATAEEHPRFDWWMVPADSDEPLCLTSGLETVPKSLTCVGETIICIDDDKVVRLSSAGEAPQVLFGSESEKCRAILWPHPEDGATDTALVRFENADGRQLADVNVKTGEIVRRTDFPNNAKLSARDTKTLRAIFLKADNTGTELIVCEQNGHQRNIYSGNEFLREITPGQMRSITYTSERGEELKG